VRRLDGFAFTMAGVNRWLIAVAVAGLAAQQTYRERVDVPRVLVDVRVVDDAGKPVARLTSADFSVRIDGKTAAVDTMEWVAAEDTASLTLAPSRAEVVPPHGRWIVFLYHKKSDLSEVAGLMRIRRDLAAFAGVITSEDRAAVVSFDTQAHLWLDFTNDVPEVRHVLEHDIVVGSPPRLNPGPAQSLTGRLAAFSSSSTIEQTLRLLGETLEPLPGAKSIIVLGYGMGTWIPKFQSVDMDAGYPEAMMRLQKARVSVFCVDITSADYHARQEGLQSIASDTGGFYLQSHIFTTAVFDRLAGALAGHYVLLVVPPDQEKGAHRLQVSLTHRRATVIAKRWYVAE
jgi:VWFA-related protein